ncbi:DUF6113 family protein [Actinomadura kijaniata]|uniref:DUF6113 family protein n=1 Tax=Actinomadura kijaniata TaxID=46161 RepID=UPI000830EAFF|nr:DUF6113 family protein [Actinomadura kijaniata]
MDPNDDARVTLEKGAAPPDHPPPAAPAETPVAAVLAGASHGAFALLGVVVAVLGSFAQNWMVVALPIPAAALALLNFALVRGAGWATGSRLGAFVPAAAWVVVTLVLSLKRPEGDLVIGGTVSGYVYIIGGILAAVGGWLATPPARPAGDWLTRGATRVDG